MDIRKRKRIYRTKLLLIFFAAAAALAAGSAVVSVNCHNTVSGEKITLFEIKRTEEGVVILIAGNEYCLRGI